MRNRNHIGAEARAIEYVSQWRGQGRNAFRENVETTLRTWGYRTSYAKDDAAGNCTTCGEAGRCPGVHIVEED